MMLVVLCSIGLLSIAAAKPGIFQPSSGSAASRGQYLVSGYNVGLFTPLENMSTFSEDRFFVLQHPAFPRHQVRMKKTRFCDETVKSTAHTGYINIEARHLFFWFFESRSNPDTDDIIYWTDGGPGGSWSVPCGSLHGTRILSEDGPKFFPESWNSNANLLAVEQPIGVGFLYADYGETVETTEEAAKDIVAFLAIFFQHFPKFRGRPLHMAGESRGGIYIPTFAAEVYDKNALLIELGMVPVNLTSIAIGNGMTDASIQLPYYYDMACTRAGGLFSVVDIKTCVRMKQAVPRCKKWMKESCVDIFDEMNCGAAITFCEGELTDPVNVTGINTYTLAEPCTSWGEMPCYPTAKYARSLLSLINSSMSTTHHLNPPSTRALLGIDANFTRNMTLSNFELNAIFSTHLDSFRNKATHIGALLERGIKALIYVGTNDFVCNWLGNEAWVNALD
ncbi:Alpha/Beta hydrolase protein [Cyathus striatus]|nr:Alpha/Beta hydrolase protein [Cyathus striatus]